MNPHLKHNLLGFGTAICMIMMAISSCGVKLTFDTYADNVPGLTDLFIAIIYSMIFLTWLIIATFAMKAYLFAYLANANSYLEKINGPVVDEKKLDNEGEIRIIQKEKEQPINIGSAMGDANGPQTNQPA